MARSVLISSRAVLLISLLLLSPVTCHDKTTRVKPGDSIQAAVYAAKPGDHIVVEAGTYAEQVTITTSHIQLTGKPGATIVPPATPTANLCSGLAGPGTEAGICISGSDITFGELEVPGHRKVSTVGHRVEGVKVEGFTVIGFGLNIAVLGAKDGEVRGNTLKDGGWYGVLTVGSIGSLITRNTLSTSALFFIGICMDDVKSVQVTQNTISDYGIGLCIQTDGADVGHNKVSDCCFGAVVDPGVKGARVTHNHISKSNPACQTGWDGYTIGIWVDGAVGAQVRHNAVTGMSDYGNPNRTATGIAVVDEAPAVARGNEVTHNKLWDNELDIFYNSTGADNEIAHNKCNTPAELCGK
jgi:nitrous oxidase accessory protein NosD